MDSTNNKKQNILIHLFLIRITYLNFVRVVQKEKKVSMKLCKPTYFPEQIKQTNAINTFITLYIKSKFV